MPGHANQRLFAALTAASEALSFTSMGDAGSWEHAAELAANAKVLLELAAELAAVATAPAAAQPAAAAAAGRGDTHYDASTAMEEELAMFEAVRPGGVKLHVVGLAAMVRKILFEHFALHKPVANYYDNVRLFKLAVGALREGLENLTTEARLRWWREHVVPHEDVEYYAVAATMPAPCTSARACAVSALHEDSAYDEDDGGAGAGAEASSLGVYDPASVDFRSNRAGFHALLKATRKQLNDGQVPLDRAVFWPGFAAELNPRQPPYRAALLAIFNTHHWALCIQGMDAKPNGFPRAVLLDSLVAFAALGADTA